MTRCRPRTTAARVVERVLPGRVDWYAGSISRVQVTEPFFALTFDDGPHHDNTTAILAVLAKRGIRATFFMLADNAIALPDVVTEVVRGGHEIGLHARTHRDLTKTSPRRIWNEIRGGKDSLEQVVGRQVRLFRPPFGTQNLRSFLGARAAGLEVIGWSASPRDFLRLGLEQHREIVARELGPGEILLLHDGSPCAPRWRVQMLEAVLDDAASRQWRPTTVGQLIVHGQPERKRWFNTRASAILAELGPVYRGPETPNADAES